jgi:hypothetical protein
MPIVGTVLLTIVWDSLSYRLRLLRNGVLPAILLRHTYS